MASVPQELWSAGLRPEGSYAYAAVIHDYLYWIQDRSRKEADKIFLIAMEDSEVNRWERKILYNTVVLIGWVTWKKNSKLKAKGERRILRKFPDNHRISWDDWKARDDVF